MDLAGILVAAEALPAEGDELVLADVIGDADERDDLLAVQLVRAAEDAHRRHSFVLEQRILDVTREDVEAAADDQILLPVDDGEVAVVVEPAHVAGVQPAVADRLGRELGRVPVARHDQVGANADFAVDDAHLGSRDGRADRPGPRASRRIRGDECRRLRQPVALADLDARHAPNEFLQGAGRERRGTGGDVPESREVVVLERLREQHVEHRRHDRCDLDAMLGNEPKPRLRLEPPHQNALRTPRMVERDVEDEQSVGMRQRQRRERALDARDVTRFVALTAGLPEIRVREHDALCASGRAPGVDECSEVVVGAWDDRRRVVGLERSEVVDDGHAAGRRVRELRQGGRRKHERRRRVVDETAELVGAQQEDRGRHDRAGAPDRVVRDRDVGRVLHQHDDTFAGRDAARGEPGRDATGTPEEPLRAQPLTLEPER